MFSSSTFDTSRNQIGLIVADQRHRFLRQKTKIKNVKYKLENPRDLKKQLSTQNVQSQFFSALLTQAQYKEIETPVSIVSVKPLEEHTGGQNDNRKITQL